MNILAYTIVDVISGWLASVFIRERTQGLAEDILIGSMGAVAGGLFAEFSGIAALSF